jgi:hypothetical protein
MEDAEQTRSHAVAVAYHLSMNASGRVLLAAAQLLLALAERLQASRDSEPQQQCRGTN